MSFMTKIWLKSGDMSTKIFNACIHHNVSFLEVRCKMFSTNSVAFQIQLSRYFQPISRFKAATTRVSTTSCLFGQPSPISVTLRLESFYMTSTTRFQTSTQPIRLLSHGLQTLAQRLKLLISFCQIILIIFVESCALLLTGK